MNRTEMNALADFIETRKVDMRHWSEKRSPGDAKRARDCGTICCAAGHYAVMRFKKYKQYAKDLTCPNGAIGDFAKLGLGLTESQAQLLFFPDERYSVRGETPHQKQRLLEVLRGKRRLREGWLS